MKVVGVNAISWFCGGLFGGGRKGNPGFGRLFGSGRARFLWFGSEDKSWFEARWVGGIGIAWRRNALSAGVKNPFCCGWGGVGGLFLPGRIGVVGRSCRVLVVFCGWCGGGVWTFIGVSSIGVGVGGRGWFIWDIVVSGGGVAMVERDFEVGVVVFRLKCGFSRVVGFKDWICREGGCHCRILLSDVIFLDKVDRLFIFFIFFSFCQKIYLRHTNNVVFQKFSSCSG